VGLGEPDDAAVWKLDDGQALVVTTDFFTPIVDDPYAYGAIAAANALSDLYAMGAKPFMALNVAAMPDDLPADIMREIFRGGAEKAREAGVVVAGGHTVKDAEPKYGLVALGLCPPDRLMTKRGSRPGDVLVLTKPLGFGVTTTALKAGQADAADVATAIDWMTRLNEKASALAVRFGVRSATDVTGYGLLGHGLEMAQASAARLRLHLRSIPILRGARSYAERGFVPGGTEDNQRHFGPRVRFEDGIDAASRVILFDAQTSGGLLLSVPAPEAAALLREARAEGVNAWPIGVVEAGEGIVVEAAALPGEWEAGAASGPGVVFPHDS
jgi:selenide,water dikinase